MKWFQLMSRIFLCTAALLTARLDAAVTSDDLEVLSWGSESLVVEEGCGGVYGEEFEEEVAALAAPPLGPRRPGVNPPACQPRPGWGYPSGNRRGILRNCYDNLRDCECGIQRPGVQNYQSCVRANCHRGTAGVHAHCRHHLIGRSDSRLSGCTRNYQACLNGRPFTNSPQCTMPPHSSIGSMCPGIGP
jgi:hypothetical protein